MAAHNLTRLSSDDLYDIAAVVDWRSDDQEVVEAIAELLSDSSLLTCDAPTSDAEPFEVIYHDIRYRIPLTHSGSDRYVIISSLAEILKGAYRIFLVSGCEGDDTHYFIVTTEIAANDLEQNHRQWLTETLSPLELGLDYFSGLRIPYYGNEDNNPEFRDQRSVFDEARRAAAMEFRSLLEAERRPRPWWKLW